MSEPTSADLDHVHDVWHALRMWVPEHTVERVLTESARLLSEAGAAVPSPPITNAALLAFCKERQAQCYKDGRSFSLAAAGAFDEVICKLEGRLTILEELETT